jgi:hypothetical protein
VDEIQPSYYSTQYSVMISTTGLKSSRILVYPRSTIPQQESTLSAPPSPLSSKIPLSHECGESSKCRSNPPSPRLYACLTSKEHVMTPTPTPQKGSIHKPAAHLTATKKVTRHNSLPRLSAGCDPLVDGRCKQER